MFLVVMIGNSGNFMDKLDSILVAETTSDLQDVLWHLSAWAQTQANSPLLASPTMDNIRTRMECLANELQDLQLDIGLKVADAGASARTI